MTWLELSLWGCNMCTDCSSPWHICVDNSFSRFSNEGLLVRPLKKNCTQPWIRKLFIPFLFSHLSLDFNTSFASNDPQKKKNCTKFVSLQHHHVIPQPWRFGETFEIWLEMGITVGCMAWELLLFYCMRKCMKIPVIVCVWELYEEFCIAVIVWYENCCCYVERESVAIVLYCCNTRRELTLKHFLNKLRRKRKRKKEVYHMIPNFQAQKATTTNHTQQR